ncbi:hypothetical protein ACP275_09G119300 [Erythranthe tilingii]
MGRVQATEEVEATVTGEPVTSSYPQNNQTRQPPFVGIPWSSGFFDCHKDQTNAVMTAFCPCVTFGQIAEVVDAGQMSCHVGSFIYMLMMPAVWSQWLMGSKYREKIRNRYGLVEAPYQDAVSHIFCSCCSLCQEFRELKYRGLDPALGWKGIIAEQQYRNQQQQQMNQAPTFQAMS